MTVKNSKVGIPSEPRKDKRTRFVQTDISAHEAWAKLIMKHSAAAAFMHLLVARMDRGTNAVVASQGVLAKMMGCTTRSIRNYIAVLEEDKWIQVVSLGKGSTNAYVVNSMVAWSKARDDLQYSQFSAQVIADIDDQKDKKLTGDLRKIPVIFDSEEQLPSGEHEEPPSQALFDGMEPELPSIIGDAHLQESLPNLDDERIYGLSCPFCNDLTKHKMEYPSEDWKDPNIPDDKLTRADLSSRKESAYVNLYVCKVCDGAHYPPVQPDPYG